MVDWGSQILVVGMKSSQEGFHSAKSDFDGVVNSLTLRQSGPSLNYTSDSLQTIKEQIALNGSSVSINILSNSRISDFKFNQSNHILSFTVNGTQDSPGRTIIPIGMLLNGPYVVSFDGSNYASFFVHKEQDTGIMNIYLSYHHSTHTITIIGTSAIPEFPTPQLIIIMLAAATGGVFLIRSRFYDR
jgi:hypothetical protein